VKRSWFVAAATVTVLALLSLVFFARRKPAPLPIQMAAAAPAAPAATEITLSGVVQPIQMVNVPAPLDGTIDQFMAAAGQHVSSGEVLARIRNPRLGADREAARLDAEQARNHLSQLESALIGARLEVSRSDADAIRVKSQVEQAEQTYQRQETMFREGVTPRLTFEKAEHEYNSLKTESQNLAAASAKAAAQVDTITNELGPARKALAQKTSDFEDAEAAAAVGEVNSPADGIVLARRGRPGENVTPAMGDLFQIAVDPVVLEVVASADVQAAARIRPGQPVAIQPALTGTVREVKSGQVFIDFRNPPAAIKIGTTVQIKIKVR
jgi:HlyD family secretion protein